MMGAQLVSRVYVTWSHLPDRQHRLLCHMALIVKDATQVPTYWGGRDRMAEALGLPAGTPATNQTLKVTVRRLIDAGAIKRVYTGHSKKRSEYQLTLERGNAANPLRGNESNPQMGNATNPLIAERGTDSLPEGVTPRTPLGTTEEGRTAEFREDTTPVSEDPSPDPLVRTAKASAKRRDYLRAVLDGEAS